MRRSVMYAVTLFVIAAFSRSPVYAITTTDLETKTATELVQSLLGTGITISNVTYTGARAAAGSFTGGIADGLSIDNGIMLSSGDIANAEGPNDADGKTTNNGTDGDADLEALVDRETHDAAILEFDFVPVGQYFSFLYVFASDEYNEYANTQFNDAFAFLLDGKNIALIPLSEDAVSINNINRDNNSEFFTDNDPGDLGSPTPYNTEFDGFTSIMWAQGIVTPGQTYHIKLAIADVADAALDSAVFIEAGSFSSTIPVIAASHSAHDYGGLGLGSVKSETFAVANAGEGNLTLGSIKISGDNASEFTIKNNTCPQGALAPAATCTFDVEFAPTTVGEKDADIRIISNAFEQPLINIDLTGSGEIYIALKTHNGAYLSAENGGGGNITATAPSQGLWERFSQIGLSNDKTSFKTYSGNYVNAENGGGGNVVAMPMTRWGVRRNSRGAAFVDFCGGRLCWENFTLVELGNNKVALKTFYGYYVTAIGGGGGDVGAYATSMGDYEIFEIIYLNQ